MARGFLEGMYHPAYIHIGRSAYFYNKSIAMTWIALCSWRRFTLGINGKKDALAGSSTSNRLKNEMGCVFNEWYRLGDQTISYCQGCSFSPVGSAQFLDAGADMVLGGGRADHQPFSDLLIV